MTSDKNIAFSELATKLINEVHETALHQKPFIKSLQRIVELLKSLKLESHVNHQDKHIKINEIKDEYIATIRMRIATSLLNLDRVIIVSSSLTSEKNLLICCLFATTNNRVLLFFICSILDRRCVLDNFLAYSFC